MSRDVTASRKLLAVAAAFTVTLGGCGSATNLLGSSSSHSSGNASPITSPDAVGVIRGWSKALRAGHVTAAARYFSIPSIFFDGSGPPVELRSLSQAEAVNAALPCGAKLISVRTEGRYVNALFRLTSRLGPGGAAGCGSGTGETARTDFLIRDGRIVEWLRAPDEPGDNGSPPAPRSTPTTPTSPVTGANPTV